MERSDAAWIHSALAAWEIIGRQHLKFATAGRPRIVTFDASCAYTAEAGSSLKWNGVAHAGNVRLPDGKTIPVGVASFAGPDGPDGAAFFVMALPSIWRAHGIKSSLGLETLMEGVLVHEIMHTQQSYFVTPYLDELTKRFGLPEDISDDSLQEHFKSIPGYVADYEAERDLLFAAAAEPDRAKARALAAQALQKMRARRARWFLGDEAKWAGLDDIFLTMEGIGQWAAYTWFLHPRSPVVPPDVALLEARRGGRHWTQDEGLALFLVIDRFVPDWQAKAFAPKPMLAMELLAQATR